MSDLELAPYAVQQRWQMPRPLSGQAWQQLLSEYLAGLARACAATQGTVPVIGHIKLLALFPDGAYLRVSAVSATHPPTCNGQAPDGLAELAITLNVLVYGLSREVLQHLTRETASALAAAHAGQVTEEDDHSVGHHAPNHVSGDHSHHHVG